MRHHRPWGFYETIQEGPGYLVKRIQVNRAQRLSLQSHQHRSEHWVVVQGSGQVTVDDNTHDIAAGEHVMIPVTSRHRVASSSDQDLVMIEVQLGRELREDDIRRYEDDYGRETER